MRYWQDMESRYGFGGGESVPPDAYESREVYVRTMNRLLELHESGVRLIAYDRPGMHNECLILKVTSIEFQEIPEKDVLSGHWAPPNDWVEPDEDDAFMAAGEQAHDSYVDDYVDVEVTINPGFGDFLADLGKVPTKEAPS
jgi:hypothetical protein